MKRLARFCMIALAISGAQLLLPIVAFAHPLGNFTINHYAGIHVSQDGIQIDYVLDMAEIPAFQEIAVIDTNRDGQADEEERTAYHSAKCESLRSDLKLRIDRRLRQLSMERSGLDFPPGQGGLSTLRLTCLYQNKFSKTGEVSQIEFENQAYSARLGWREIVITTEGPALSGEFAATSPSQRLTAYPNDLLSNPLDQRSAAFRINLAAEAQPETPVNSTQPIQAESANRDDAFTRLILTDEVSAPALLLSLVIAFTWGAAHALTPGHGKTIVGAYLIGSRGTPRHALFLGLTTTIAHTFGVFVLGLVTLFASRYLVPEDLFPWLSLLSGILVVGIGLNLLIRRLSGVLRRDRPVSAQDHSDEEQHAYHGEGHDHGDHEHLVRHHGHDYGHRHNHDHPHDHQNGPGGHSHLPPGADGSQVTWRSILMLGVSGGLLPCPSALVVMLSAIALDRIGFGLVLVVAFSLGLAGVLSGIGLAFVYAKSFFKRLPAQSKIIALVPAASALFITMAGLLISIRALVEMRW